MAHISIGVSHHALRIVFTRLRLMPDLLATVQGRIDPVSVTVSGGYKPLYQKSTSGYLHVMQRQASWPLPAHVT